MIPPGTDLTFYFDNDTDPSGDPIPDITEWDTSSVTIMRGMFLDADAFNQDISAWDTSSVTNMAVMFAEADAFNQDLSAWDTSSVTDMGGMFADTDAFNQDLSAWDTSSVTYMDGMFADTDAFNQDISAWDTSSVTNMAVMFQDADAFNQDLSAWDISSVTHMVGMFLDADAFNQDLSGLEIGSVTAMNGMLDGSALSTSNYDATLLGWHDQAANGAGVQNGVQLGAGGLVYSDTAAAARQALIDDYSWTINGDSLAVAGNEAPTFTAIDTVRVLPGAVVGLDLSTHFSDEDTGDVMTYTAVGLPPGLSLDPATGVLSGTVEGTGEREVYTISVNADDNAGGDVTTQFDFLVGNTLPEVSADTGQTTQATAITWDPLANDSDADGDMLSVVPTSLSAGDGMLVLNDDGTLTFTPNDGFSGEATISYDITDGFANVASGATITVNDPPQATDDALSTDEGAAITFSFEDLLSNDTDIDGDALSLSAVTNPTNGTLADNGDDTFTYTPNTDFHGEDSFTYMVSDGELTDTASVSISVAEDETPTDDDSFGGLGLLLLLGLGAGLAYAMSTGGVAL